MMSAVRDPQSKPPNTAFSILRASIRAMMSRAITDCCALRKVLGEEKARGAVSTQVGNNDSVALGRQQGATST